MPAKKRNYRKEYDNYHKKPKQKKRRAARNASRAKVAKTRSVAGKDVHHKDHNPRNKKSSNLSVQSKSRNRSNNGRKKKTNRKKA